MRDMRAKLTRTPRSRAAAVALAAVLTSAAASATLLSGGQTTAVTRYAAATQRAGAAGVAAAFGYPQRCLTIAISSADPDYARADVLRTGTCANYRGYVNASFHRVDGVWKLVLDEGQLFVPNSRLTSAPTGSSGPGAISSYPFGCLSLAIILHDPRFGRADFDRGLPCARSQTGP
jgi:hypothetical protein